MTAVATRESRTLSLRSRVLIGFSAIAAIAIVIAVAVTAMTHSYLLRQLDERLSSFAGSSPFEGGPSVHPQLPASPLEEEDARPSDVLRGFVDGSGRLTVYFAPNVDGAANGAPLIRVADLPSSGDVYLNVASSAGGTDFRVYVRATDRGWDVTAMSMGSVSSATQQLILIEVIGILAMLAGLALIAWWVIRLGIAPMRRMVDASSRIAGGDLHVRLDGVGGSEETAQLAGSLNAMISTLTASLAERERSEARLREFVADASHELRTPLTTILGYSELHRRGALSKKADATDAWARTESEAARMRRLVEDMLELAKYDAEPELARTDVDLVALSAEVVRDATAAHSAVEFTLDTDGHRPVTVVGDSDKLRQALINVVANAGEHGGQRVAVALRHAGSAVTITVTDDGPGMAPEVAERATERFVRGDHSRTRATGGAGLGLAITAAIVDAHGGTLSVASVQGEGAVVAITLPDGGRASTVPQAL